MRRASPPASAADAPSFDVASRVLYREPGVLIVDKPAGIPSTGRELGDPRCWQTMVTDFVGRPVWAVHQLDAETSGVLVLTTRRPLVARWAERMRPPRAEKVYLAVCHGALADERLEIDVPLARSERGVRPHFRVALDASAPGARRARTRIEVLARSREHLLLRATLFTGRPHQIRLHLAHVGLPLVGEKIYRTPPSAEHTRQALHAWKLVFRDGAAPDEVVAPIPADLRALAKRLALALPE
jgi:23S rRNA-/tRNA-specific pseudouridylate synthase